LNSYYLQDLTPAGPHHFGLTHRATQWTKKVPRTVQLNKSRRFLISRLFFIFPAIFSYCPPFFSYFPPFFSYFPPFFHISRHFFSRRESEQQAAYRASLTSLGSRLSGRLSVDNNTPPTPAAEFTACEEALSAVSGRRLLREENVRQLELTSLGQVKRSKARRLILLNDSVSRKTRALKLETLR
jgi:hypothetical protein